MSINFFSANHKKEIFFKMRRMGSIPNGKLMVNLEMAKSHFFLCLKWDDNWCHSEEQSDEESPIFARKTKDILLYPVRCRLFSKMSLMNLKFIYNRFNSNLFIPAN